MLNSPAPALTLLLLLLAAQADAAAAATDPSPAESPVPPPAPPPRTEEPQRGHGWDILPFPLVDYSTDTGLGYGARVMFIDRGDGDKPYRLAIVGQFYQTTRAVSFHLLQVDAPHVFGSPWRVNLAFAYFANRFSPYYGLGNQSAYDPALSTCEDRAALAQNPDSCPDNPAFRGLRYYVFDRRTLPSVTLIVRRDLGGPWKLFGGYKIQFVRIYPEYPQDLGQHGDSRLVEDAKAGLLTGYNGQSKQPFSLRVAEVTAGLVFDSRDNEPAPIEGMFHELSVRASSPVLGSEFTYWGLNTRLRLYHPVIPGYSRLVVAARILFDMMGGDVPFYLLSTFGGLTISEEGVGGAYTLRGIPLNRYQGKEKLVLNGELRWRFATASFLGQQFDLTLVSGLDAGHAWTDLDFKGGGGLHLGADAGLRLAWNRDLIVRFDYGFAINEPGQLIYLDFGHMF